MFRVIYLMNLDYRKGSINYADLNSSTAYDPTIAFNQSQLANMLSVQAMAKDWAKNKITVNAVRVLVMKWNTVVVLEVRNIEKVRLTFISNTGLYTIF